jgi:diadenosine tetraphosphatase ApaH/serine/threonine PP2A family protein phosphatase
MTRMGSYERIALISDVHGNLTALEAVLDDIDARGIGRIFNLGDYVGKGPRGREVVEICRERCEVNILGNWDDFLPDPARTYDSEALAWWLAQVGPDKGSWLRGLPFSHDFTMSGRRIRLFHASAASVHRRVRFDHDEEEFLGMFENTELTGDGPVPTVVGYGDTHDAFYEVDHARRTLFNTGSVGNSMGDPTPVYVVLEGVVGGLDEAPFSISFVRVPYDVEAEVAAARDLGMPELDHYAVEIRHGIYRGDVRAGTPPRYHRAPVRAGSRLETRV